LVEEPDYKGAQLHFQKAIDISADFDKAHYNLAVVLNAQNEIEKAESHFEDAININNDYAKAHFHLALLLKAKK
jgi:tetratricopeptide (TPR) repeat protein